MPRFLSPTRPSVALAAAFALACLARPASGQGGGFNPADQPKLKAPVAHQIVQRDARGLGEIPVVLPDSLKDAEVVDAQVYRSTPGMGMPGMGMGTKFIPGTRYRDGKIERVPAGGPYSVTVNYKQRKPEVHGQLGAESIFVGDLWVLAGQSNMEGVGKLVDVTPPHDRVMALGMDGAWVRAEEPLHWLVDSPDPVHSGDPSTRAERSAKAHKTRSAGTGLGLPFAAAMVEATGVPVGLVICAHGGTSMDQWSPSKKDQGGNSLYGSMLRQVKLAGGKVKGLLWYQGESDANEKAAPGFSRAFADFIGAVRSDFDRTDLPFYFVQIGRFINDSPPTHWNAVQDAQRKIPDEVANTAVVAAVDLELDDLIHVGTPGHKRLGKRLARIALREQFGQMGGSTPTLDRVTRGPDSTLVVKFRGVNLTVQGGEVVGLRPARHIGGFSIRKADGKEVPLILDAQVGPSRDAVVLKLIGKVPEGASLWYGWGRDPYCNLADSLDMAVPVFGPIALDGIK